MHLIWEMLSIQKVEKLDNRRGFHMRSKESVEGIQNLWKTAYWNNMGKNKVVAVDERARQTGITDFLLKQGLTLTKRFSGRGVVIFVCGNLDAKRMLIHRMKNGPRAEEFVDKGNPKMLDLFISHMFHVGELKDDGKVRGIISPKIPLILIFDNDITLRRYYQILDEFFMYGIPNTIGIITAANTDRIAPVIGLSEEECDIIPKEACIFSNEESQYDEEEAYNRLEKASRII